MRITVTDDEGVEQYVYDTNVNSKIVFPGVSERTEIGEALEDALNFLRSAPNGEENGDEDEPGEAEAG